MKISTNLTTGGTGTVVQDALRTDYNLIAKPKLIADWNFNLYSTPIADNTPSEQTSGFNIEAFPIESIYAPWRPAKGITKARVGSSLVSQGYTQSMDPKFYLGSVDDIYKYWSSPYATDSAGVFPTQSGVTTCAPFVVYPKVLKANKIVIKTENTWAHVKNSRVKIRTTLDNNAYTTVSTNPTIPHNGVLVLYYNGTAWSTTRPAVPVLTDVAGIKFEVDSLQGGYEKNGTPLGGNPFSPKPHIFKPTAEGTPRGEKPRLNLNITGANSFLCLIAIEAHMEVDFSDRLISTSDQFDMAETSQLYPVGTITSNQGDVTLDNTDGIFNWENAASPYYRLMEPNVEFNLEYIYTIGGTQYSVQQFKLYSETWSLGEGDVSINLQDASKYLKSVKPNQMMYENNSVTQVIWRVLDSVGFVDYEIQAEDVISNHNIPVFWTTGEQTAWEVLDDLANASQTAIYFDAYGKLQVRTREAAFDPSLGVSWTLRGQKDGTSLPDIVSLEQEQEFESNSVDVLYKNTEWRVGDYGEPAMSAVWEPEEDVLVVRSAPIVESVLIGADAMNLGAGPIAYWPYSSLVQLDGELIRYNGKLFAHYTGASGETLNYSWVKSEDEKNTLHKQTPPDYRYKNYLTGHVDLVERGVWNTSEVDHLIDTAGWTTKGEKVAANGTISVVPSPNGFSQDRANSLVTINPGPQFNGPEDTFWVSRGSDSASGYKAYGTRLRINNNGYGSGTNQRAGLMVRQSTGQDNGYYVEVRPTRYINNRNVSNEVMLFIRRNRSYSKVSKGIPLAIAENVWYDLDIYVTDAGAGKETITVYVNGQICFRYTTTSDDLVDSGKFSMVTRGNTSASFEYVYAIADGASLPDDPNYSFYDLKYGATRGGGWDFEQVWQMSTRYQRVFRSYWIKAPYRKNVYVFDEFGPYCHEVREFDVNFDPAPVQYSQLFSTNTWYSANVEYIPTPWGAKFIIANTSRNNAILHGEDALSYGGGSSTVNQVCVVLGRDLVISDAEKVTVKNQQAINARGLSEAELSSDWIQSKAMAQDIADWIVKHWGSGVDELRVEIFGNPLIEIGDVVAIDYDEIAMTPETHQYFVTGTETNFDQGLSTTLTLRRALSSGKVPRPPVTLPPRT